MDLFLPMLGVGLVTSVHCVAMCGSMVLTYAVKGTGDGPFLKRMVPHVAYHSAKLISYITVGLVLGMLGSAFNLGGVRGYVTVLAGLFMVLMGLNMTGKFPALQRYLTLRPPKFLMKAISSTRKNAMQSEDGGGIITPITFGLLTGLMPCGPLQSAELAAAAAGTPLRGAFSMFAFGLGTMPLMLGFGAVSGALGAKFKDRMMIVSAIIVMVLGVVMLNRGAMLLGSPVNLQAAKRYALGSSAAPAADTSKYKTGKDGVIEVPLTIENVRFVPQTVSIPSDKPVRLVVNRKEENPCSAQLAVPQLGVLKNLAPDGVTTVDIPASKSGAYTLTCGMGMMSGQLAVGVGPGGGKRGHWPEMLAVAGLVALGIWSREWKKAEREAEALRPKRGRRPQPAPAPAFLLGFTPPELFVLAVSIFAAVIVGLLAGSAIS